MRTHFTFYSDPADPRCGWLIVTLRDLEEVGLSEMDFTRASYTNGQHIGLEEDVDAPKFLGAYKAYFRRDAEIVDDLGSCLFLGTARRAARPLTCEGDGIRAVPAFSRGAST